MKRKRWIAAFLSLVMILTMVSPVSAKGFSKDSNSSGDKYSWSQTKEESPNDKKETSQETASVDETAAEEAAVTDETDAEETTSTDEAAAEEETSEETAAAEEAVAEEETPVYMDGSLTGSDGIYNVTVTLGADAQIPEGSSVSVKELTEEDAAYQEAKEQVQAAEEEGFAALDISILDKEGNEIEPKAAVEVEIQLSQLPENVDADTEITVNHIDESTGTAVVQAVADTAEETEGTVEVTEDAAVVNFTVDSFSTFTITYGAAEEAAADDGVEASDETEAYVAEDRAVRTVTLLFNRNQGNANAPASITGTPGTVVQLPDYSGRRSNFEFIGWADTNATFPGGTEYRAVYEPGSYYELPDNSTTLYAAWQSTRNPDTTAYFFIRLDGTIPYEPGSYAASAYTAGIRMTDAVTVQNWVVDNDTTKDIDGNHVANDVVAALNATPSDQQIAVACQRSGITYDPDEYYILWYVQKYQAGATYLYGDGTRTTNDNCWHIDGVLLRRELVSIAYNANVPAGVTTQVSVPLGYQVESGTIVTVGESGGVGGSTDLASPTLAGYTFVGWNTRADGSGTMYQPEDTFSLTEDTILYAIWAKAGNNVLTLSKQDAMGNPVGGASFSISYTAEDGTAVEANFTAGTYTNTRILTDTVYTIQETAAPAGYTALADTFSFIVKSDGSRMSASFCDEDGATVSAPTGVTLTCTDTGTVNITVTNTGYFYVYHSSVADGDVETIAMTTENLNADGTFNIVNKTKDGYYYGGYYSKYNKVGTVYAGGVGSWTRTYAYTDEIQETGGGIGTAMTPVAGQTYYIKEVPETYLQPYLHIVYDQRSQPIANEIKQMYLMSGIDDTNYANFGLKVTNIELGIKTQTAAFKVVNSVDDENTVTLTTKSIWKINGYLGVWNQTQDLGTNVEFTYQPYFVTPDGVEVVGTTVRSVNTQDNHYYGTFEKTDDNTGIYCIDK